MTYAKEQLAEIAALFKSSKKGAVESSKTSNHAYNKRNWYQMSSDTIGTQYGTIFRGTLYPRESVVMIHRVHCTLSTPLSLLKDSLYEWLHPSCVIRMT